MFWNALSNVPKDLAEAFLPRRSLTDEPPSELVDMIPFDVTIALTQNRGVDMTALSRLVNLWLRTNFRMSVEELAEEGVFYNFDQIILSLRNNRRDLKEEAFLRNRQLQTTFIASYEAKSLWKTDLPIPDETTVAAIELEALLDRAGLEKILQEAEPTTGLGMTVVAARASLNRDGNAPGDDPNGGGGNGGGGGGNDSLSVVIIVAIVIAALALSLLSFALFMAWRSNKRRRELYKYGEAVSQRKSRSPGTSDTEYNESSPPRKRAIDSASELESEIAPSDDGAGLYPESVISDDINTSLSAYYQSGMAGGQRATKNPHHTGLNDAASVSSIESYGYSLDGYASSIAAETK